MEVLNLRSPSLVVDLAAMSVKELQLYPSPFQKKTKKKKKPSSITPTAHMLCPFSPPNNQPTISSLVGSVLKNITYAYQRDTFDSPQLSSAISVKTFLYWSYSCENAKLFRNCLSSFFLVYTNASAL